MPEYIHLHNHTHYSLLDGALTVDALIKAAAENRMPAVGLTDHGVMFGVIEFYKKALKAGIKPIVGMEAYIVTKGSRKDKTTQATESGGKRGSYHHMLLFAKDLHGYKNLMKLCTLGHTEGYYYKPRIDTELLRQYREGLLGTSACAGGVVNAHLANNEDAEAYEAAEIYKEILGDDFYIEIQNHGIKREAVIREKAPKLARELGLKLICSNDVHYLKQEHAIAHNILLLIPDSTSATTHDYAQLRYQTDQVFFKSEKEMVELFREYPEALRSTIEVMEKCNLELDLTTSHMPQFPIPPDAGVGTIEEYFEMLAREGFTRRYPEPTEELTRRFNHEIAVIKSMGYAGYFLVVQDFIAAARRMGVAVGPGRGSAAGSVVSYALGITNVDPVKYDLLFERFLNPDRVSMPDIDVDFSDTKRDKVIQYVRQKYGEQSVSQIITFNALLSRAVLKDVGRVLGVPLSTIDSITKQIPMELGKVRPLQESLDTIPELKWVKESTDPKIRTLIEASMVLEGINRGAGMHPAGVVIAPGNIGDYVPLYKTPQTELMTQYNMNDLEAVGLLKMDFLGLRTLSVIENALAMIKQNHGVEIDLESIPENDAETFELFARGDTVAVFQFESAGMRDWLCKLKPTCISDLVAMNALYRPGPMDMIGEFIERKHGRQEIRYLHPKMEGILKETYGVIVYQEQVMKIATEIAGFTLAKADLMRRAMGKKNKEGMAKLKSEFIEGAVQRGTGRKLAGEIFDLIEKFASYGFNKSHSVAYSIVAYQTAYLKAHYPAEYMAATLSSEIGDSDRIVMLINDCRKMGIRVLPPDVNESGMDFQVVNGDIRFGLCAIKGVGESAIQSVIKTREEHGKFENLFDFCRRIDLRLVNKKCLESLVQAGAFDSMGGHRALYYENIERAAAFGAAYQEQTLSGQSSLFDTGGTQHQAISYPSLPPVPAWSEHEKLMREKNVLGLFVSGHPLQRFEQEVREFANVTFGDLSTFKSGSTVRACGIVTHVKRKLDKRGNTMAFIGIEDFTGRAECIVFSDPFAKFQAHLHPDSMLMVVGKGEVNGESLKILVNEVYPMDRVKEKFTRSIILSINVNDVKENTIIELRNLLEANKGNCPCFFDVIDSDRRRKYQSKKYSVEPSEKFLDEAKKILGPHCVRLTANNL